MFEEKCQKEKEIFSGSILKLNEDMVKLKDWQYQKKRICYGFYVSCCVILDKKDNIILIKQYRYAHKKEAIKLPGGQQNNGKYQQKS